jgi:hypothetical protein
LQTSAIASKSGTVLPVRRANGSDRAAPTRSGHARGAGRYRRVMQPALRHYLVTEHAIGAAVVNFVLNALIAWLAFGHLDVVPMWGSQSVVGDTVGTIFVLTALTCLIATRIVRWHVSTGRAPAGPSDGDWDLLRKLPAALGTRSLVLAGAVTVVVAPEVVGLLAASGLDGLSLAAFVAFKAIFAALLAVVVQPVVALRALMETDTTVRALPAPSET